MLKAWFEKFLDNVLYVQVSALQLRVLNLSTGAEFNEAPFIATELAGHNGRRLKIKAIGVQAQALINDFGIEVVNPFVHPRLLIANFPRAEMVMTHAFKQVCRSRVFSPSPRVVVQPMERLEGGLTDVEARAFREMCLGAGAREVVVYVGAPLTSAQFNYEQVKQAGD